MGQHPEARGEIRIGRQEPDQLRPLVGDETGQWPDAETLRDRFRDPQHGRALQRDPFRRDMLAHESGRLHMRELVAERDPVALVEQGGAGFLLGGDPVRGAAIDRPGDRGDAPSDQRLARRVAGADRDIGIALRQVERLIADDDIQSDQRMRLAEGGEDRQQHVLVERVGRGNPQFA